MRRGTVRMARGGFAVNVLAVAFDNDRAKTACVAAAAESRRRSECGARPICVIRNWKLVGNNAVHGVCSAARCAGG